MKHPKALTFTMILAVGLLAGLPTLAFSDSAGIDPRDVALVKAIGGMAEGSRILSPEATHAGGQPAHGTPGSHVGSAAETHHPAVSATAPRLFPAAREVGSPLGGRAVSGGVFVRGSSGSGTSTIEINADANLETDNPSAGGDITITPEAGGGLLDANTETTTGTGSQEVVTSGTSGDQNSIIEADAGVDLSGGSPTVEAEVAIDPNASGGLVDAEAATSTDLVEQELVSNAGLEVDNGANTTAAETTTVSSETGSTAVPATNEVEGGVEADVEGAGAGDDVECNPADGILCPPKL